jgi:hypothetical protein
MPRKTLGEIEFGKVYPMYVKKVERKGRTKAELDEVIRWLTGYDDAGIEAQVASGNDFQAFFDQAPALNPDREKVTGMICGYRVEEIDDPITRKGRQLDKLVDELAKGKAMEKILRD